MRIYFEDISQAFFFRNRYFGALLLFLFLAFDRYYFICGAMASLIAYGYTLSYSTPKQIKDSGLITLNGLFYGIAMASLFKESPVAYLCLTLGAISVPILTKAVFEILQHWKLDLFVFPYLLAVWTICLCASGFSLEYRQDVWPQLIAALPPLHTDWPLSQVLALSVFRSMGRLFFFPSWSFGLAVFALITLFNPRRGAFFLLGSFIGSYIAFLLSSGFAWEYGFLSYSAGLVGLGLASLPQKLNWKTIVLFSVLSCFLTLAADELFRNFRLPALSLPYVLTMWIAALGRSPRVNLTWVQTKPTRANASIRRAPEEHKEVA